MTDIMVGNAESWPRKRLGQLFRERREKVSDKDFPPLSVTKLGILPQLDTAAKSDDGDNRKGVRAGDFVINSRSDRKGSGGLSNLEGSVSLINIVLEPVAVEPRFAHHLLRSGAFQEEFYRWGHGIVADLWTTRYSDMKNIVLAVPNLRTQNAIADFLDRETALIDQLIEKKQRMLALVNMEVRGLSALAVSGDMTSSPRKPSGIEWAPDVPVDWQVLNLSKLFHSAIYGTSDATSDEGSYSVLRMGNVQDGNITRENMAFTDNLDDGLTLCDGDILFNRTNSRNLVGKVGVFRGEDGHKFTFASYLVRIRPSSLATSDYLGILLNSDPVLEQARALAIPSISQSNLNPNRYGTIKVAIPPVPEQERLVSVVAAARDRQQPLVKAIQASAVKLSEFRSALITAAVTGQIDVTTWGKQGQIDRRLEKIQEEMGA